MTATATEIAALRRRYLWMATSIFFLDLGITVIFMVMSGAWGNAWRTVGAGVILLLALNWMISRQLFAPIKDYLEGRAPFIDGRRGAQGLGGDRLHGGERVLHPVVQFVDQQPLPLLRTPALAHVVEHADDPHDLAVRALDRVAEADDGPSYAIGQVDPILRLPDRKSVV